MKSYKAILFVLFSVFLNSNCLAQKEKNIWYFGEYAGVDFNTNPPTPLTNSSMYTQWGCTSIADSGGNLLFYTNGIMTWNRNHDTMSNGNGLFSDISCLQSSLIIKQPGSDSLFYIFLTGCAAGAPGFFYCVVDMSQEGGLGKVVLKNVPLRNTQNSAKLTAIKDATGCNYWIITHDYDSDEFYSYSLTQAGIDTNVVISHAGYNYANNVATAWGDMKASPDGKKLAVPLHHTGKLELFSIDNSSGVIYNPLLIDDTVAFPGRDHLHCSFSPNSKLLYSFGWFSDSISQFNVSLPTAAAIHASRVVINKPTSGVCEHSGMQLGPDGRIYLGPTCPLAGGYFLGMIRYPDIGGAGCSYTDTGLLVSTTSFHKPLGGLPNFIDAKSFRPEFSLGPDTVICNQPSISLEPRQPVYGSFSWNTGDTGTQLSATSTGQYWLKLNSICGYAADTINITLLHDTAKIKFGPDTLVCGKEFKLKSPAIPMATYLWSTGGTGDSLLITNNGIYWLKVNAYCGNRGDTIKITFFKDSIPNVNLGNDTVLCAKDIKLKADSFPNVHYLWSTGDTTKNSIAANSGQYWVQIKNYCQAIYDTINIILSQDSIKGLFLGNDTLMCSGILPLNGKTVPSAKYLWSTGDTGISININGPGTYWLQEKTLCETARDSIVVRYFVDSTTLSLGKDTIVCGPVYNLSTTSIAGNHYLWNTGDTGTAITAGASGQYWLKVSNICNIYNDTVNISIIKDKIPSVDFGKDTILCAKDYLLSVPNTPNAHYTWSSGDTAVTSFKITKNGTYWLKAYNYCETKGDTITIGLVQDSITSVSLGKDTLVCDTELELDAGFIPKATYYWSTEDTVQKITVTKTGSYAVEVSTYICNTKLRDTVRVDFFVPKPLVLQDDTTLCEQVFENLTIKSPLYYNSYTWNTGETNPEITVNNEGSYILAVKDICDNNFTDTVNLQLCDCKLYIPNAFTPNKNGLNDRFTITSSSCPLIKFNLKIFNRWGQLIYETNDPALGWDGTYLGEPVPVDAYIYSLSYRYAYMHTTPDFTGIVNVIR